MADFTEGLSRTPTLKGNELASRTANALKSRLATSAIGEKVEIRRICAVRNQDEALKAGQSASATLVLWGNVAEYAEDTFEPAFTFINPLVWPSDIDPLIFEVELNRVDSVDLPSKISARTTSVAAFVIGLIYLNEANTPEDYNLAAREFSFAIANTEPELATLNAGSEQEFAIKRTLAIFYVMRGRAYAALNDAEKAIEDYSASEASDPTYPSVYVAKGNYYYALRDFSQAEIQYKKAISLRDIPTAYYGLGNARFYLGQRQESIDAYLKAISLIEAKGDDPSGVRIILGTAYKLAGYDQLALEQLDKVVESPQASEVHKQQAQDIITSILYPALSSTPVPSETLFPTPPTPMTTLFPTGTLRPTRTLLPTGTPTRMPTLFPTGTLLPTPPPPTPPPARR